jgi:hypothetical protein
VGSPSGSGYGGGVYIADAEVGIDEFTVAHITANTSSTSYPNTYGPFDIVPDLNPLPGDFDRDGTVDAADYVVWRKTDGTEFGYNTWRAHFGQIAGNGGALTYGVPSSSTVPEPGAISIALSAVACMTMRYHCMIGGRRQTTRN